MKLKSTRKNLKSFLAWLVHQCLLTQPLLAIGKPSKNLTRRYTTRRRRTCKEKKQNQRHFLHLTTAR